MLLKTATSRNIFAVAGCGLLATMIASGTLFYNAYSNLRQSSIERMQAIANSTSLDIENTMAVPIETVNSLDVALYSMKAGGQTDREAANRLMSNLLQTHPNVLGTWSGWEPDAFDGKDKDFVGKEAHDATGRFVPYWVRSGDKIQHTALVDYTKPGAGDYYLRPLAEKRLVVVEPYIYPVDGKDVLMTSVTKPIIVDGRVVGVAGADLSLADTKKTLSALRPMGTGWIGLVTAAGNIISHPDDALTGKTMKDMADKGEGWTQLIDKPGEQLELAGPDGTVNVSIAYPVHMPDGNLWYAVASVPRSTVFAELDTMALNAGLTVAFAAVLLTIAGWLIARKFVGRIENVISETDHIANGSLDVSLRDIGRKDEIGDLSRSLGILLDNNRRKVELEAEAERNRAQQDEERRERARVSSAQEEDVKFAVSELGNGLKRLANGDMTMRLERPFAGVLESIRDDFNVSVEKLQTALLSFSENARMIEGGSAEIRSAADNLARRTEQQAASVEETAAALDEITTSVKDSTRRAEEAGTLVERTKSGAEKSGEVVRDAVQAMSAIEQSSQSISNIIGVIDEIAFQTNLLALNAGVEAARAGEAGKGFAVVAQEVRELAQRSAQAAKEIKSLIMSSGEQVKRGVTLVGQTGSTLETIVAEVQRIDHNVQAIVQAAREQSTGLQEINAAVNQMDQATQQNAGMVEESNAAAHTLVQEVESLTSRLSQFNLGSANGSAARRAAAGTDTYRSSPSAAPASRPQASRTVAPAPATAHSTPAPSPVHGLGNKLASAFSAPARAASGGGAAAAGPGNWEEF